MVPASYHILERATGVEPASSAWKAEVLPMNYARVMWSGRQDSNLRHPAPKAGALPDCATSRRLGQPGSNARASQGASDYRVFDSEEQISSSEALLRGSPAARDVCTWRVLNRLAFIYQPEN